MRSGLAGVMVWAAMAGCTGAVEDPHGRTIAGSGAGTGVFAGTVALPLDSGVAVPDTSVPVITDAEVDAALDAATDADAYVPPPPLPPFEMEPAPGTWSGTTVMLTLTPRSVDTQLYYTLDNSYPTTSSTPYTTPIALTTTSIVRVAAYEAGVLVSMRSGSYVQLGSDVETFTSNLPLVVVHMLDTPAPSPSSYDRVPAIAQFHVQDDTGRTSLLGEPQVDARIGIKVRGRSTRGQPKVSYTLEVQDQVGEDQDVSLFGMPQQSDWALYAPYEWDRSMVRNAFWYALSRSIGRYAPRTRFCEVFLADNGQAVDMSKYQGTYVLTETLKRDAQRVDIEKLGPADATDPLVTGGYLIRVDEANEGDLVVYDIEGIPDDVRVTYPDDDERSAAQSTYIEAYLDSVGRAVARGDQTDPTTAKTTDELIDLDAFIDHHILNTLAMNPDAFRLSGAMYKARGEKLMAGPLWDCDRCMGSYDDRDDNPQTWFGWGGTDVFGYGWYAGLFDQHPTFETQYWARFDELLQGPLSWAAMEDIIDELAAPLDEAAARNAARWPGMPYANGMYRSEIDNLKTWLDQRVTWVTANTGMR